MFLALERGSDRLHLIVVNMEGGNEGSDISRFMYFTKSLPNSMYQFTIFPGRRCDKGLTQNTIFR